MPELPVADLEQILAQTNSLWDALRGARLFLTGGTGFFGQWLLESLLHARERLALDCTVTVLTRDPDGFATRLPHLAGRHGVTLLAGDVASFTFPNGAFTHVIHAATPVHDRLSPEQALLDWETIVAGTQRVLAFARQAGAQRLLLTSSGAVYGRQPVSMAHMTEDYHGAPDPLNPASVYGEGKRAAELLCTLAGAEWGLEAVIARGFAFVGPGLPLDRHFAAGNFIRDALRGAPIRVNGDGTPYRSYLYAADLAVWLWTLLLRGAPGRAYNMGSDTAVQISELARRVARLVQPAVDVAVAAPPDASRVPERYVPDIARARHELGLRPTVDLDEGLQRTIAWHRSTRAVKGEG